MGISVASNQLIALLKDDGIACPDRVRHQLEFMEKTLKWLAPKYSF